MLVLFGGLPGTGKTVIARQVAARLDATYLRIDAIEQALRSASALSEEVGPAGYEVAYALASANLRPGHVVVADCVNPLQITREAWRAVAAAADAAIVEIEIICSDAAEHRRRVETRAIDIPGLVAPTWAAVIARDYQPWLEPRIVIDTAHITEAEALSATLEAIQARSAEKLQVG